MSTSIAGVGPWNRERPIGRDLEVAALKALLLRPDASIVTVTGPGGVGKTTLARFVCGELAEAFTDGAAFVDLTNVEDHTELAAYWVQANRGADALFPVRGFPARVSAISSASREYGWTL